MDETTLPDDPLTNRNATLADAWHELSHRRAPLHELAALLEQYPSPSWDQLGELLLIDQQSRWCAGPGPRVEEYLQWFPGLQQDSQQLVDLVYGEARARTKLHFHADVEHFITRFPLIAAALYKQFELADWLNESPLQMNQEVVGASTSETAFSTATDFGPYELIEPIARGGMGIVFKARHQSLDRVVALKMIPPERLASREEMQRFRNEIYAVSQLDHPAILSIYEVGESNGVSYFTSRLIEPGSLADNVDQFRGSPKEIAELMCSVASAVHHAHQRGVLHRDIKPSNVLVDVDRRPYVTDFGLAKLLHQSSDLTHSRDLVGTPVWIAPEQAVRKPRGATIAGDVYGLGAVLYFLLTGRPPFDADGLIDTLNQVRECEPTRPSRLDASVNRDLEMICVKAMDKDAGRRYPTASAVEEDIKRFLRGEAVVARPLPWWERQRRSIQRHPVLAGVSSVFAFCVIVLVALATYYTLHERQLNDQLAALVAGAETSRQEAGQLRNDAALARQSHRLLLYAARMKHAAEALRVGDARQANEVLNRIASDDRAAALRGFEWYWLQRQIDAPVVEVETSLDNPRCLTFSADGRRLAIGDSSGKIALFNTANRKQVVAWETPHEMVQSISFHPASSLIATGGDDGSVRVWSSENGAFTGHYVLPHAGSSRVAFIDDAHLVACNGSPTLFVIDLERNSVTEIAANLSALYAVAASASTSTFAAIGDDGVGLWQLESTERRQMIATQNTPTKQSLEFAPDGQEIAFRSAYREVQVWSVRGSQQPSLVATHPLLDEPWGISYSPHNDRLAVCDRIGAIHVWSRARLGERPEAPGSPDKRWQAHPGRVNAIAFSPAASELASIGKDGTLKFWQPVNEKRMTTLADRIFLHGYRSHVTFARTSPLLAAGSEDGIQLWDLQTKSVHQTIDAGGPRRDLVAIAANERYLAAGHKDARFVELWNLSDTAAGPLWRLESQQCDQLLFSPDDQLLAVVDYFEDEVAILAAATGETIKTLPARQCWAAAFSPDGANLAITVLDDIEVWRCDSWELTRALKGHGSTTTTVAYSPDGKWLASGGRDRAIRLWDSVTGEEVFRLFGHQDIVDEVAFSPDSKSLVSTSHDGTVKVWHVATGEALFDLLADPGNPPFHVSFSSDGNQLAVRLSAGQIMLLDLSRELPTVPE